MTNNTFCKRYIISPEKKATEWTNQNIVKEKIKMNIVPKFSEYYKLRQKIKT